MAGGVTSRSGLAAVVLGALFLFALVLMGLRFTFGLSAIANINDGYPWGWWVGFGVMSFISLGACGFTMALLVDVLGFHRFEPFVRPGLVLGLLFYLGYAMVLVTEIGRPWKAWILFLSWAHTSALFEIAWCATIYTTCLILEFGKVATEKLRWMGLYRVLAAIYLPVVVLGVTLSHFHQSSLGTMMTIVPLKVDDRWWSELLPLTFLLTAYSGGMALITVEHVLATRWLGLKPRVALLADLGRFQLGVVIVFLVLRFGDLIYQDTIGLMLSLEWLSLSLWTELLVGYVVPLGLLAIPTIRNQLWGTFTAACLLIFGNILMRLNITVFGLEVQSWQSYSPAFGEVMTTVGVLAGVILAYGFLLRVLPIHDEEPLDVAEEVERASGFTRAVEAGV